MDPGPSERAGPLEPLLRGQWAALRAWLDEVEIRSYRDCPSGLPAWSIHELVAHLGFGLVMLDEVEAAPRDARPLPVGEYIARYRPAAPAIAEATSDLAATMEDELAGIDALAARAWAALESATAPVVLGRRGPLTRNDFLLTRLIEVVVHGDDLHRAVPIRVPSPLLPQATSVVAETLARAYELRGGQGVHSDDAMIWIRTATGRLPSSDPRLPLL